MHGVPRTRDTAVVAPQHRARSRFAADPDFTEWGAEELMGATDHPIGQLHLAERIRLVGAGNYSRT